MAQQLEAIYENGVLRPLEPIALRESQRVTVTIADAPPPVSGAADDFDPHRYAEQAWLKEHSAEYRGQWVALQCSDLVSHGADALEVHAEALRKGVQDPLLVHISEHFDEPSAGLLQY